jgi:hypothetical protein
MCWRHTGRRPYATAGRFEVVQAPWGVRVRRTHGTPLNPQFPSVPAVRGDLALLPGAPSEPEPGRNPRT